MSVLIDADALNAMIEGGAPLTILDVRWKLGVGPLPSEHEAGHVPGAVYADLDTELSTKAEAVDGKSPMPSIDTLQAAARRWGLNTGDTVVVYDDAGSVVAGRALWLLKHAGVADVRMLDGGLGAWNAAGMALESGPVHPSPGDAVLRYGGLSILDMDAAAAFAREHVLLDARPYDKYTGENETMEPRAGHIPGAVSAPASENFSADGGFLPVADLERHYAALGVTKGRPVGVYCGAGTSCSADFIALTLLGHDVAVYPGSWSQWAANSERPAAVGAAPFGDPE